MTHGRSGLAREACRTRLFAAKVAPTIVPDQ